MRLVAGLVLFHMGMSELNVPETSMAVCDLPLLRPANECKEARMKIVEISSIVELWNSPDRVMGLSIAEGNKGIRAELVEYLEAREPQEAETILKSELWRLSLEIRQLQTKLANDELRSLQTQRSALAREIQLLEIHLASSNLSDRLGDLRPILALAAEVGPSAKPGKLTPLIGSFRARFNMKIVQLAHCNPVDVPKMRQGAMDILTMVADLGFGPWYLWQISREAFSLFESIETNPNRSQDGEGTKLRISPLRQRLAEIEALIETVLAAAVQVL